MPCPSCGARVDPDAWICGACDHILDPSVLEPKEDQELPIQAERTRLVAWAPPEENDEYPDAVILGDVGVAEEEFSVVAGAQAGGNGRTSTFLFYAGGSSTRVVHPHAIPHLTDHNDTLPRTPYEDFILSCIDGDKSVRQIQKESGLAPQEIVVTLLTLMDKGAVDIRTADGRPGASPRAEYEEQLTESEGVGTGDNSDFEDLPEVASSEIDELQPAMLVQESAVFERPATQDLVDPSENVSTRSFEADDSASDVWSADELVEKESTVHESSEQFANEYESLTPEEEAELPPVMPSPLEDDDGTEPTRELEIPAAATKHLKPKGARVQTPAPVRRVIRESSAMVRPVSEAEPRGPSVTRSKAPSRGDIPAPSVSGLPAPSSSISAPSVSGMPPPSSSRPQEELPPPSLSQSQPGLPRPASKPVLDASFLSEVEKSNPSAAARPAPSSVESDAEADQPTGDAGADLIAPPVTPKPLGKLSTAPAPAVVQSQEEEEAKKAEPLVDAERLQAERKRSFDAAASAEPVDSVRMLKAQRLFEQALKDKAEGNLVSARMNVKLALTFDPSNELFATTFDEMSKNSSGQPSAAGGGRSIARDLYDQATSAENRGDVDSAVELLEKAIRESKNPAFYNRLGVILAMKKQEFSRAQEMIEKAIELAPNNGTYEKNLHKVLSRAALHARKGPGGKRKGIRGLFGRRK